MITFNQYKDVANTTIDYLWIFPEEKKLEAWAMISESRSLGCSLDFSLYMAYSELYREPLHQAEGTDE